MKASAKSTPERSATILPQMARVIASPALTATLLLLSDILAILAARYCGARLWSIYNPALGPENYFDLGISVAVALVVYGSLGLYTPAGLGPVDELRRSVGGAALVALSLTGSAFLAKESEWYSRGAFFVSSAVVAVLVPLFRALTRSAFASKPWWGVPVAVLGAAKTVAPVIDTLRRNPELGYKPVACLDHETAHIDAIGGVPVVGTLRAARDLAGRGIRHAMVAMHGLDRRSLVALLENECAVFSHVIVIPDLFGVASLWVAPKDLGGVLGLELRRNLLVPVNQILKRALDIVVAAATLLVTLPIVAAAALWVRLTGGSPVLYRQQRLGEGERPIEVWKLRTMHVGAEEMLERHLDASPDAREEWERFYKLKQDPRLVRGGAFLRRTSVDEFPQLWNVLRGEMSLVGPRPLPPYHLDRFSPEFRALRSRVKPGVTGLWQVSARSDGDLAVQEALDSYYIRNWSVWLDLYLLARTFRAVLLGRGAY
ncbi:MAG: undecaprenyl-phosphate galactose phosphotransferase WbaP [Bryobacteraceae bacterium]